ncbi:MAG TPA: hypothetical protein VIG30_16340, partial [Ktedonobacterales bacterium]
MKRSRTIASIFVPLGIAAMAVMLMTSLAAPAAAASARPITASAHHMSTRGAASKAAGTQLVYQGGAVETTPLLYISWWGPQWKTGFSTGGYTSAQAQTYITGFYTNVGGSSWDNIDTQYCQGIAIGSTSCGG